MPVKLAELIILLYVTVGPVPSVIPDNPNCRITWLAYRDVVIVLKPGYETASHHLATVTCGNEVKEFDVTQDEAWVNRQRAARVIAIPRKEH